MFANVLSTVALLGAATEASLSVLIPKMMISMAVVFACMWIGARILQRRKGLLGMGSHHSDAAHVPTLEVVSRHRLSKRQDLLVVRVDQQTLLIGATDASINVLTEIRRDAALHLDSAADSLKSDSFRQGSFRQGSFLQDQVSFTADATGTGDRADSYPTWKGLLTQVQERTVRRT